MELYIEEVEKYADILERYKNLTDTDIAGAYKLKKDSLILADRFSDMLLQARKNNKVPGLKNVELKDRIEHIYKLLKEIHVDCRQISNRKIEG